MAQSVVPPSPMAETMSRPQLHITQSFPRYEPEPEVETRQRAASTTMHLGTITDILGPARLRLSPVDSPDVFETKEDEPLSAIDTPVSATSVQAFPDFEDMPIELVSLTDRYVIQR